MVMHHDAAAPSDGNSAEPESADSAAAAGSSDTAAAEALERRIQFALEADRLKSVIRRTRLVDGSRHENSAEHSWQLGLLAMLLADAAPPGVDHARVIRMLLIHDIIEVDAGDTFAFDTAGYLDKADREQAAAARLYGILPGEQGGELHALWEEFEIGETPDARFAVALDRFQPLLLNFYGGGGSWREHGISRSQVLRRMAPIEHGAPALWPFVLSVIEQAWALGWVREDEG